MTVEEQIEIMEAFLKGKDIQYASIGTEDWHRFIKGMSWNFQHFKYRLKPDVKEYIPYSVDEFLEEQSKHNSIVESKMGGVKLEPFVNYAGKLIMMREDNYFIIKSLKNLCEEFVWADDKTPCGKEIYE